jgi:hypothetical protein
VSALGEESATDVIGELREDREVLLGGGECMLKFGLEKLKRLELVGVELGVVLRMGQIVALGEAGPLAELVLAMLSTGDGSGTLSEERRKF